MSDCLRLFHAQKLAAELAKDLRKVAEDLDEHIKNTNIARVTGGVAGVVGGGK